MACSICHQGSKICLDTFQSCGYSICHNGNTISLSKQVAIPSARSGNNISHHTFGNNISQQRCGYSIYHCITSFTIISGNIISHNGNNNIHSHKVTVTSATVKHQFTQNGYSISKMTTTSVILMWHSICYNGNTISHLKRPNNTVAIPPSTTSKYS